MKITFVLERADMSGGVRAVAEYARQLIQRGHEVVVYSVPHPKPALMWRVKSLVRGRAQPLPGGRRASHLDGAGVKHVVIDSFRPIEAEDLPDADVVIATWWETAEWVAKLPAGKGRKFHLIQHYEVWGGPVERVDALWRLPMKRIVIAKWLADLAREKFGDSETALVFVGLDHQQFHAPVRGKQRRPTIGMHYSSREFKGCDVALAAVEEAGRRMLANPPSSPSPGTPGEGWGGGGLSGKEKDPHPNPPPEYQGRGLEGNQGRGSEEESGIRLVAFGAEAVAPSLPLPRGAIYSQNVPQEKLRDIYAECDVFLCGSRGEGFVAPPLEAMACGCPVVSTKVGGPVETVVDGVNGYLAEIGDVSGLADGLMKVLALSDAEWRRMSAAARSTANRYTWQAAGEQLELVLMGTK